MPPAAQHALNTYHFGYDATQKVLINDNNFEAALEAAWRQPPPGFIKKCTGSNGLLVLRGKPQTCIRQIIKDWKITHLVFEKDSDTYARQRDSEITEIAESLGVEVISIHGRTLYDPELLTEKNEESLS
ncbi:hypothetical protein MRB53_040821 [Persea americana]|nr:hypothetical protein MRB53_040821 [Persea americana]